MSQHRRILNRRDISTVWQQVNPKLGPGEIGVEVDTLRLKVGNGQLRWNDLPYCFGSDSSDPTTPTNPNNPTGPQDPPTKTWTEYASQWTLPPEKIATITEGDVYKYTYSEEVLYRLVPTPYDVSQDGFYRNFSGTEVSDLVTLRIS